MIKNKTTVKVNNVSQTTVQKGGETGVERGSSKFISNNWLNNDNPFLKQLQLAGGAFYIAPNGGLWLRIKAGEEPIEMTKNAILNLLCVQLNVPSILLFNGTREAYPDISRNDLQIVQNKFSITSMSEFYEEDGKLYRTSFIPSDYLQLDATEDYMEPKNTLKLLQNLTNNKESELEYLLNWLAGFIQTMIRPHTAILFCGDQGTGKGLLAEQILQPIFGKQYVSIVDNDRLASRFNGSWAANRVFYIFNEISIPTKEHRTAVKNKMKPLITDQTIQMEFKGVDPVETNIVGASMIFSNENLPIEIEPTDRRYYVIQTGRSLKRQKIDTAKLVRGIECELKDFTIMLKCYDVDWDLYHAEAPMTDLKKNIINNTNTHDVLFVNAIKELDILYFSELEEIRPSLYKELEYYFAKGEILFDSITKYFEAMYPDLAMKYGINTVASSRKIMERLRSLDYELFAPVKHNHNIRKSNGKAILKITDIS